MAGKGWADIPDKKWQKWKWAAAGRLLVFPVPKVLNQEIAVPPVFLHLHPQLGMRPVP